MIPILYEKNETSFTSNGICRLHDCLSVKVTEERNGVYECDFDFPVTGNHYDEIQLGRIIAVTHDDTGDIQPFDIMGFTKPINGIVTFHAVHVSYRMNSLTLEPYMHINWKNTWTISELSTFLTSVYQLEAQGNKFSFDLSSSSSGSRYMEICDDMSPKYLRSFLGGVEGSVLDTFHGEYLFDKFTVYLKPARGVQRDFTIRYGVNMTGYTDESDGTGTANGVIGYWKGQENGVDVVAYGKRLTTLQTITGRDMWKIYDYSSKFSAKPDYTTLQNTAEADLRSEHGNLPSQTIQVSFVNLKDSDEYAQYQLLMQCQLCDTIKVIFPDYNTYANMKIVKVVYDVLKDRYESMELGDLSTTLSQALGVSSGGGGGSSSGGGGTTDYNDLSNKPQINGQTLTGNKTAADLSLVGSVSVTQKTSTGTNIANITVDGTTTELYAPSGGGGGTTDYNDLTNKPQINSQTLTGNKTASDLGLVANEVTTIAPTITASTGTLVSCTAFKFGKMVFMTIAVRKTSSTASGANIFTGTLSETAYRPKAIVTGASYYDAHAISAQINTSGAIVFRNASPSAVTIGSSYSVAVSFTYMID